MFPGNGDGTFLAPTFVPISHSASVLLAMDVNGDGKPDLISGGSRGPWLAVLINQAK